VYLGKPLVVDIPAEYQHLMDLGPAQFAHHSSLKNSIRQKTSSLQDVIPRGSPSSRNVLMGQNGD
jgi:hypothetical protein